MSLKDKHRELFSLPTQVSLNNPDHRIISGSFPFSPTMLLHRVRFTLDFSFSHSRRPTTRLALRRPRRAGSLRAPLLVLYPHSTLLLVILRTR